MEFLIEIVVTAFALGGVLGAIVALHLSANLKQHEPQSTAADKTTVEHPPALRQVSIKARPDQSRHLHQRRR